MSDGYARPSPTPERPGATTESLPPQTDLEPRCQGTPDWKNGDSCNLMLAKMLTRPWVIDCRKCGFRNERR